MSEDQITEKAKGPQWPSPPYVSYRTFKNFLDGVKVTMPARIDRSVMSTLSGAVQSQLSTALKSLKLISGLGIPTHRLEDLAKAADGSERKALMADLVRSGYPYLFDGGINLETATGKQLLERFEAATGASGDTLRKAASFFLAAAKEGGIPVSPYFKNMGRGPSKGKRRKVNNGENGATGGEPMGQSRVGDTASDVKTVKLRGAGGELTLTGTFNALELVGKERALIFQIVDLMTDYEREADSQK